MTIDTTKLRAETLALIAQEDCDWCVDGLQADGETPCSCRLGATSPASNTLRHLDEIDRLRAEVDAQRERAEEAESQITRAQELVSAEFEGDCWKTLRALLDRTDYDWTLYGDDGVSADDAFQWITEELDRLAAENDRLRAQVQRLREALEPFAVIADIFDSEVEGHSDTDELSLFYGDDARWLVARFTLAQFNAALFSISEDRE